jgi:surface polysaccharide O-acyltransferase-like enzyme
MEQKKVRQTNLELLRILAMFMVIILHYLGKGGFLTAIAVQSQPLYLVLETLSIVAVNLYVLISGYFSVETEFSLIKLIRLWAQILFYSLLIPMVLSMTGILSLGERTLYDYLFYIFPVTMEHYWFATTFLFLYLIAPFLNKGIKALNKKQFQTLLLLFVLVFSISKSVLPVKLAFDKEGYDIFWFITLYLTAAYLRIYGIPLLTHKLRSILLYLSMTVASILMTITLYFIKENYGIMEDRGTMTWDYNHIFVYLAAIGLFTFFLQLKNVTGKIAQLITAVSSTTFGIYLFHEHVELRYLWMKNGTMGTVLLVFFAGMMLDFIRQWIFRLFERLIQRGGKHEKHTI